MTVSDAESAGETRARTEDAEPCARCQRDLALRSAYLLRRDGVLLRRCLGCALRDPTLVQRSLRVALIVGTILNLGNQGAALFDLATLDVAKATFTYLVPYAVATYGALSNARTP